MSGLSFSKIISHPYLRSSALVTILSFVASIGSYLFNLIVVKAFPITTYGEYAAANSYIGLLSVPILAFGSVIIRRIGQEKRELRPALIAQLEVWIVEQFQLYALSLLGLVLMLWWIAIHWGNMSFVSLLFIVLSLGLLVFQNFYGSVLQSKQYFGVYGLFLLCSTGVKVFFGLIAVILFKTLLGLYASLLATALVAVFLGRKWAGTYVFRTAKTIHFRSFTQYLRSPRTLIPLCTLIGIIGLSSIDVIVAKAFLNATDAGLYGTLSLLSKIILFVTTPMSTVAFVFFTDAHQKNKQYYLLLMSLIAVLGIGLCGILGYLFFPALIIRIIASSSYLAIAPSLWAGAVFGTLYSMVSISANFLISKNHPAGCASILAVVAQLLGLYFFHNSLLIMMVVNGFACFLLLLFYAMVLVRSAH